jgi:3-oxoacyl-(acyl-carrier-protein) synthase
MFISACEAVCSNGSSINDILTSLKNGGVPPTKKEEFVVAQNYLELPFEEKITSVPSAVLKRLDYSYLPGLYTVEKCLKNNELKSIAVIHVNNTAVRDFYEKTIRSNRLTSFNMVQGDTGFFANLISKTFDLKGLSISLGAACSSFLSGIQVAKGLLNSFDGVLIVSSDTYTFPFLLEAFKRVKIISPTGETKPFSKDRNGFVVGEAGVSILFTREQIIKDSPEIVSISSFSDNYHFTDPDPTGVGHNKVIKETLNDKIGLYCSHGTGTVKGDLVELESINSLLDPSIPMVALKSYFGHTMASCGGLELITSIALLEEGISLPVRGNYDTLTSRLNKQAIPKDKNVLLKTSFGFGGRCNAIAVKVKRRD